MGAVIANEKELSRSINVHDVQSAVIIRLLVVRHNAVAEVVEHLRRRDPDIPVIDPITAGEIDSMFEQFNELRNRSDYKDLKDKWYFGEDLSNLPPEPEPEAKEEAAAPEVEDQQAGDFVFGGDYAGEEGRSEAAEEQDAEDEMPEVPPGDDSGAESEDREDVAVLP